jgi:hypothetical protein
MSNWQKVFSDKLEYRAEIVMAVLKDAGFQPVLINKKDSSYQWGYFEVLVAPSYVLKAIKIIENDISFK